MKSWHRIAGGLCGLLVLTIAQARVSAQLPTADLSRLDPRAARAGETIQVNLSGTNLEDLTELRFTHAGITAKPVTLPVDEFFSKPRIAGSTFTVTIAQDVPPGIYEARAVGHFGLSTARPFVVASKDSNEISESGDHASREKAMTIPLNSVVTGTVASRGIDWFKFDLKANQRVQIEIHAERIDSRMDGLIVVYDSEGIEIGRNRDHFGRDSFLTLSAKQDGEFYLAVSDMLFRGSSNHFYRLSISDRPHIDFVFPPAGEPGSKTRYTLYGRNLRGSRLSKDMIIDGMPLEMLEVEIELPNEPSTPAGCHWGTPRQSLLRGMSYRYRNSNSIRIGFATAPVVVEEPDQAVQKVVLPIEVAGRFDHADDEDVFRFATEKGKTYWVEVIADRMASNVDPLVIVHKITSAEDGTETRTKVAENDDMPSFFSLHGKDSINADTNDAAVMFQSDDGGDYSVTIVNQFGGGGTADLYRLAIREPKHDFQLMATSERPLPTNRTGYSVTPHLRQGAKWGIRILAPRQDGFAGDIVVTAEDLPAGVSARPLTLSGKTDRGILIISAERNANSWAGRIRIVGRAKVGDRELIRDARFASLVWGHIFSDSIRVRSRLTSHVPLSVNGHEPASLTLAVGEEKEWTVEVGQKLEIPVKVTNNGSRTGNLTVEPHGLFGMLRNPPTVNIAEKATEGTLTINFTSTGVFRVEPGRYQFALQGIGVAKYRHNLLAAKRAEADRVRIEKLTAEFKSAVEQTKTATDAAKQALEQAKRIAAKATPDSKQELEARAKRVQAEFDIAANAAKAAADRLARAEKAKSQISQVVKSTENRAVEKSIKFAAWSDLITVTVNAAAKKK